MAEQVNGLRASANGRARLATSPAISRKRARWLRKDKEGFANREALFLAAAAHIVTHRRIHRVKSGSPLLVTVIHEISILFYRVALRAEVRWIPGARG